MKLNHSSLPCFSVFSIRNIIMSSFPSFNQTVFLQKLILLFSLLLHTGIIIIIINGIGLPSSPTSSSSLTSELSVPVDSVSSLHQLIIIPSQSHTTSSTSLSLSPLHPTSFTSFQSHPSVTVLFSLLLTKSSHSSSFISQFI